MDWCAIKINLTFKHPHENFSLNPAPLKKKKKKKKKEFLYGWAENFSVSSNSLAISLFQD